jgi:hypothetical protein
MSNIPTWVNCQNEEFLYCDYYMSKSCPESCAYAKSIKQTDKDILGGLEKDVKDG